MTKTIDIQRVKLFEDALNDYIEPQSLLLKSLTLISHHIEPIKVN